jgi:hypothetical protein
MKKIVIVCCLLFLVLFLCQESWALIEIGILSDKYDKTPSGTIGGKQPSIVGRYQIYEVGKFSSGVAGGVSASVTDSVLLDTATGKTWLLKKDEYRSSWEQMEYRNYKE